MTCDHDDCTNQECNQNPEPQFCEYHRIYSMKYHIASDLVDVEDNIKSILRLIDYLHASKSWY